MSKSKMTDAERTETIEEAEACERDAAAYLAKFEACEANGQPALAAKWARLEALSREEAKAARERAAK